MASVEVEGLRKAFHDHDNDREVLRGVTFNVPSGDIVSLIGPSGSGKTTVFRCILGEVGQDAGTVRIDGEDVSQVPIEQRGVGVVYQSYALFPHLNVEQNVGFGLRARKVPEKDVRDRAREMLSLVRLEGKEKAMPRTLSGGEKQRVALARALAVKPRVLLLDEAFTALDATTRGEIVQEVRSIIRRLKVTTLLVTHDQEEAFLFARRVVVLNEGQVILQGTSEEVMAHGDPFVQGFVKMVMMTRSRVEADSRGRMFASLDDGTRIPIEIPTVQPGEEVHVVVKKGATGETIGVWRRE